MSLIFRKKMALFHLFVGILILINFTDAEDGKDEKDGNNGGCTTLEKIMLLFAGVITTSLVFSICCFASKYKTSARRKKESEKSKGNLNDESQLSASQNEGSCESDQKSYAYSDIKPKVKSAKDIASSVKTAKSFQRESYDFVEHHRANSFLVIENDIPNPYNHVTIDMEVTEYDNASHVKPRIEIQDPTYSHLYEVKSHSSTKENIVTGEKDNHLEEEINVELETTSTDFDICDENAKNETNGAINDECKEDKLDDNRINDQQDVHGLNRHKAAYSVVWKSPNVDKVAENNTTENAFIFTNEKDSSSPIAKCSEDINTSNDNGATISLSQSGSEKSSSQNRSDTESL